MNIISGMVSHSRQLQSSGAISDYTNTPWHMWGGGVIIWGMRKTISNFIAAIPVIWVFIKNIGMPIMIALNIPEYSQKLQDTLGAIPLDYLLIGVSVILLTILNWSSVKRFIWGSGSPQWIPLHKGVDYMNKEAKFALPTRKRPLETSSYISASVIQLNALGGKLKIKGHKENSSEYEIIDPDFWRLAHFDWLALLNERGGRASKTDIYGETFRSGTPVPKFIDLLIDLRELKELYPPQTRWDKSKFGRRLRDKWAYSFRKKESQCPPENT
ncbi:MAG: hypothetical protein IH995_08835 [Proteobacteria bacterium]|nr:hypothetical protein [Pseudomonadota bacterium]